MLDYGNALEQTVRYDSYHLSRRVLRQANGQVVHRRTAPGEQVQDRVAPPGEDGPPRALSDDLDRPGREVLEGGTLRRVDLRAEEYAVRIVCVICKV